MERWPTTPKREPAISDSDETNASCSSDGSNLDLSLNSSLTIYPIAKLNNSLSKWTIKACVMSKSAINTWSNDKGVGTWFSMHLCDEIDEIRAVAFDEECARYYDMIQVGKVYYISGHGANISDVQFKTLENDNEIKFDSDTDVVECTDNASSTYSIKYNFVPISKIQYEVPETLIDVIGVCHMYSDFQHLTSKNGNPLIKLELALVDSSGGGVILKLWNADAENFDKTTKINPVIAVKGAAVEEFMGTNSLSCIASTMWQINPDIPEAHALRDWYNNENKMRFTELMAMLTDE